MITARCPARAALAGNPSDGFGGSVFAVPLASMVATVTAERSAAWVVDQAAHDLLQASVVRLEDHLGAPLPLARLTCSTSIPRTVGLAGSSAIVIAALRALCELAGTPHLDPDLLASLALSVETDVLGIAAGLQDRVVQAYGLPTLMDFAPAAMRRIDGLPAGTYGTVPTGAPVEVLIASRTETGESSHVPHSGLHARAATHDPDLAAAASRLATQARGAANAWRDGDIERLARHLDATFDVRQELLDLEPAHVEMIETARARGCAANYTGSGGSVAVVSRTASALDRAGAALAALGCRVRSVSFPADRPGT